MGEKKNTFLATFTNVNRFSSKSIKILWPLVTVIELPFIILLDSSKDETEIGGDHFNCTVVLLNL